MFLLCHRWLTTTNLSYSFLFLKLPPPPCAVLLVVTYLLIFYIAFILTAPLWAFNLILLSVLTHFPILIWDTLQYHGCDASLISLLRHLFTNMRRCFRYAGCVGSFWYATYGLLQGDPLSVVILNCVLCPLLNQRSTIQGLSFYAFADDLTVVSSSWDTLYQAYQLLQLFCSNTDLKLNSLTLLNASCGLRVLHLGLTPLSSTNLVFVFTHFYLAHPLISGFLVPTHCSHTMIPHLHVLRKLPNCLCLIGLLTASSLPLFPPVIITLHFHATWHPPRTNHLNTLLLQFLFISAAGGCAEKLFTLLPPLAISFHPNSFWTTDTLSNISSTSDRLIPLIVTIYQLCEILPFALNGAPSFGYATPLRISPLPLRTLLSFSFMMLLIPWTSLWTIWNILLETPTANTFSRKLLYVDMIVRVRPNIFMFSLLGPSIHPNPTTISDFTSTDTHWFSRSHYPTFQIQSH